MTQLEYLGHIISSTGLAADPHKVQMMQDWPVPKDLKSLRGFLGLTGYYSRFVQEYGVTARPLTKLLKKNNFCCDHEALQAFQELKNKMIELPMLTVPNFKIPFEVETDASGFGIGALPDAAGSGIGAII